MGKPLDPGHDHRISLPDAAAQARLHRQGGPARSGDSGAFNAKAVLALLAQPGCVGLRYYKGRDRGGDDTMILVGVDTQGNDIVNGELLEVSMRCPPFCSDANPLNT
jgi:hypothetical protein